MSTMLNKLDKSDWRNLDKIIVFGYGRAGKKALHILERDFQIVAIIENDPEKIGKIVNGVKVLGFNDAIDLIKKYKTIVTVQEFYYREISIQLESIGLKENSDFVSWRQFVIEWYFMYRQMVCLEKTDLYITPFCSLNCEKCHLFMPYWKEKKENSVEDIKRDLDLFFSCVDYLFTMDIAGGEPFLYLKLKELLEYIGSKYRSKIGYLGITTNGTILPKPEILDVLNRYDISVAISDYALNRDYSCKLDRICEALVEKDIEVMRSTEMHWFDFGFPQSTFCYAENRIKDHMLNCNTVCHALERGRLYYCGTDLAAQKSGLFPECKNSYIDLCEIDRQNLESKRKILEFCIGNIEGEYLRLCKVCGGFGSDNQRQIPTAKQFNCCSGDVNENSNFSCQ